MLHKYASVFYSFLFFFIIYTILPFLNANADTLLSKYINYSFLLRIFFLIFNTANVSNTPRSDPAESIKTSLTSPDLSLTNS